jgi:quercetin dioxygenase-like cupin family protein
MKMIGFPFGVTDWSSVERTEHAGEAGFAYWRTLGAGEIRVRMVEYTPGYAADHWCAKGHVVLCLEGELRTELEDGRIFLLAPGMSYLVSDDAERHRSSTQVGATLFIVD